MGHTELLEGHKLQLPLSDPSTQISQDGPRDASAKAVVKNILYNRVTILNQYCISHSVVRPFSLPCLLRLQCAALICGWVKRSECQNQGRESSNVLDLEFKPHCGAFGKTFWLQALN